MGLVHELAPHGCGHSSTFRRHLHACSHFSFSVYVHHEFRLAIDRAVCRAMALWVYRLAYHAIDC